MKEDQINEMIMTADIDGDGQVSYEEFLGLMMAKSGR